MLITPEQRILKAYLGDFFCPPIKSPSIINKIYIDTQSEVLTYCYQLTGISQFKQVVQAVILSYGQNITYKVAESYRDVIEVYCRGLNRDSDPEDQKVVENLSKPTLLVIYKPVNTMVNKQMIPLCLSVAESRTFINKKTVFITFKSEPDITAKMPCYPLAPLRDTPNTPTLLKFPSQSDKKTDIL